MTKCAYPSSYNGTKGQKTGREAYGRIYCGGADCQRSVDAAGTGKMDAAGAAQRADGGQPVRKSRQGVRGAVRAGVWAAGGKLPADDVEKRTSGGRGGGTYPGADQF